MEGEIERQLRPAAVVLPEQPGEVHSTPKSY